MSPCPDWCIVLCWCVLCIVMGWRQYINTTTIWRWQVKTDRHLAICFPGDANSPKRIFTFYITLHWGTINEAFNIHSVHVCLRELSIVKSCQSGLRRDIRNHFCPHLHTFIHQQFLLIDPNYYKLKLRRPANIRDKSLSIKLHVFSQSVRCDR